MRAEQTKQLLKNSVYRALGESHGLLRADRHGNVVTVSPTLFTEQMAQLRELEYTVVDLHQVIAHYREGGPLPPRAVLITFDDGYRDTLENALPVLRDHAYPAVMFVPIGYLGEARPLPHDESLAARGLVNRTLDWSELAELEAGGVRIESHGISHRPLSEISIDEAARDITISKLRLEERLGRPVEAFAYAKGAQAHYGPIHVSLVQQAGYRVEPYSARTFELVLAGACDLIGIKDTVPGTHTRRLLNAALGTSSK